MKQQREFLIDGEPYIFGHWDVFKATETLAWMVATFGPAVRGVFQEAKKSDSVLDMDIENMNLAVGLEMIGLVVTNLGNRLTPQEYAERLRSMTSDILYRGAPVRFETHFMGRIKHLHMVVKEVLAFQYADFFDAAKSSSPHKDDSLRPLRSNLGS